ncbi:Piso0_005317 [Millerozyma farinosa CBS 7064]|uniref:SWR1-complex protein 5 n=1 Tax=Pichia sorbitophila (strain ATCC MYA-4447 / BCRC 22081 / CBS 7064 / NBRC 10061 / NRRL Y-12695) TaxID=559304 RepID=G8Y4S8_PICSO|nr:Piso0_005317 [Millerozyma farinosa CBS 7064]
MVKKEIEEAIDEETRENRLEKKSDEEQVDEDYDEEEDEDYDPDAKAVEPGDESDAESDISDKDERYDYSAIQGAQERLVKTRRQRIDEEGGTKRAKTSMAHQGLVRQQDLRSSADVDAIFRELKASKNESSEWQNKILSSEDSGAGAAQQPTKDSEQEQPLGPKKIKMESSYVFAGRLVTESKFVDADSAEAKAYLNSTKNVAMASSGSSAGTRSRSSVPVFRQVPGVDEPVQLRIKLKRPSLIDKFLTSHGSKKNSLSTLEKSRLDWASFVDQKDLQDELKIHNKAGYLDKQEFLGRLQEKRDVQFQKARVEERQRQWALQNASQ